MPNRALFGRFQELPLERPLDVAHLVEEEEAALISMNESLSTALESPRVTA